MSCRFRIELNNQLTMEYNECKNCKANNGRAGNLISSPSRGIIDLCRNCFDTKAEGAVVIHTYLARTPEEINLTINLLNNQQQ